MGVQFSSSVVSDSLWPHGLQHTRLPCPLSIPGFMYIHAHTHTHTHTTVYLMGRWMGLLWIYESVYQFKDICQFKNFQSSNHWTWNGSLYLSVFFCSGQLLSHVWLFATPWTAQHQASLSITKSWSLLKLISIMPVMLSNHLILWCPLLLPFSIFPSIRVFSNESVLHIRLSNYWSFSFSICPSNEYSGLISFRINWFDLLAIQGTL